MKKKIHCAQERNHTVKKKGNAISSKTYSDGQENLQNIFKAWELGSSALWLGTVPAVSHGLSPPCHLAVQLIKYNKSLNFRINLIFGHYVFL